MEETSVYEIHHWECPYCGYGYEQEEDVPDIFDCEDCGRTMRFV